MRVGGTISSRELRKITRRMRSSILGPTAIYYAGVTAPAIAAGVTTVAGSAFARAGWTDYWVILVSAIIASMAGISWYLIFMRLSYRHGAGRSSERIVDTVVEATSSGLSWQRGDVSSQINWAGISGIRPRKSFIQISVTDATDLILPLSWFGSRDDMQTYAEKLDSIRLAHTS